MTTPRNPIYEGALTLDDIKSGRRVARMYPHIGNEPTYYTLTSDPFMRSTDAACSRASLAVSMMLEGGRGIATEAFLSDMGVIPRESGGWNTNFVVWRSHGGFAGRCAERDPRVISARMEHLLLQESIREDELLWAT